MSNNRNAAIDFVKGCAVIGMLVHHSLNYYPLDFPLIKYMRFVTGSFIFISGFVVSHFYVVKYGMNEKKMYLRLLTRAIKLLVIFTSLNILIKMSLNNGTIFDDLNATTFISNIYIYGNYNMFYFDLLVPIAYVLILTSLLIFITKKKLWLLKYITFMLFIFCSIHFFNNQQGYYLRYVSIGLIGAAIGFIPKSKLESIFHQRLAIITVYLIHIVLLPLIKLYYPLYVFIVILNLLFFYIIGLQLHRNHWLIGKIILLGEYSLISYLFQIAALQVFKKMALFSELILNETIIAFLIVTLTTYLFIEVVHYLRKQSTFINKCYKLVFA